MTFLIVTICGALSLTILVWISRSKTRRLGTFEEEAARLKPLPKQFAGYVPSYQSHDQDSAAGQTWETVGGMPGYMVINFNAGVVIRVIGTIDEARDGIVDEKSLFDLEEQAMQIRKCMPLVYIEWFAGILFDQPRLHSLRMASLYCDLIGSLTAIAEDVDSVQLRATIQSL